MSAISIRAYKVLQVDREASPEVIEAAYRRLAKMYHPDVASGREATMRMAEINAAHDALKDPASRRAIDRDLAHSDARGDTRNRPPSSPHASSSTQTGPQAAPRPPSQPAQGGIPAHRPSGQFSEPPRAWFADFARYNQVQNAIAIIAFLIFVVAPLFDHFSEPITSRISNGLVFWSVVLAIEVGLDYLNWRTTPLFRLAFLAWHSARRLLLLAARLMRHMARRFSTRYNSAPAERPNP